MCAAAIAARDAGHHRPVVVESELGLVLFDLSASTSAMAKRVVKTSAQRGVKANADHHSQLLGPFPGERAASGALETRDYLTDASAVPAICRCGCCRKPLMAPRQRACCGVVVCAAHAEEAPCSSCGSTLNGTDGRPAAASSGNAPDEVQEALASLEVHCPRASLGCQWRGAARALAEHFAASLAACGGWHKEGAAKTSEPSGNTCWSSWCGRASPVTHPPPHPELFGAVRDGRLDEVIALLDSGRVLATAAGDDGVTPLLVACAADRAAVVEELLLRGADANAVDRFGRRPLSEARSAQVARLLLLAKARATSNLLCEPLCRSAEAGHLELVRLLLKAGADATDAVLPALKGRQAEVLHVALAAGADLDVDDYPGDATILETVLSEDDLPALRLLLAAPRKPTLESPERGSSLAAARSRETAELLLAAGASVHHRNETGATPLHCAHYHPAVLELLIERSALVNATNDDGATPLHLASTAAEVRLLLEHGASVHSVDRDARTPLFYAQTASALQALLAAGADANVLDAEGNTPFAFRLRRYEEIDELDTLLAHTKPAAVLCANSAGLTPLRLAVRCPGLLSIAKRLIALGANVGEREPATGRTLLMEQRYGRDDDDDFNVLVALLQAGADVRAVDDSNRSALWHAASSGRHAVAAYLLERDPSLLSVRDHVDGWTPLHCASTSPNGDRRTLQLFASRATPEVLNARDMAGRTALCLAAERFDSAAIGVLLDAGAEAEHARTSDGCTALMICASWVADRSLDAVISGGLLLRRAKGDLARVDADGRTVLAIAAAAGNEWMVQRIMELGEEARAILNVVDNDHCTPLLRAVLGGSEGTVKALLAWGAADIEVRDKEQRSALSHAASLGCNAIVAALAEATADAVHSEDAGGYTPLLHAAVGGHAGCVAALLAGGARIHHAARDGETALTLAARHGHAEVVEALLEAGRWRHGKTSALTCAIVAGHVEVVRKLLGAYVDVNACSGVSGWSPLLHASYTAQEEVVRMLVRAGARVDRQDDTPARFSPLLLAACAGHMAIVELLLKRGADASAADAYGDTALVCACRNGHAEVARRLLLLTTQTEEQESQKKRAFLDACANGHTEVVERLLVNGVILYDHCVDAQGRTPLILAAAGGYLGVVRMLLGVRAGGCGGGVAAKDKLGWTALAHASAAGHTRVVAALLDADGADANTVDVHGNSPLSFAVANLHVEAAQLLLERGKADVNHPNERGVAPLLEPLLVGVQLPEVPSSGSAPLSHRETAMLGTILRAAPRLDVTYAGLDARQWAALRGAAEVVHAVTAAQESRHFG